MGTKPWIIWAMIALHVAWATLLVGTDAPLHTTPAHALLFIGPTPTVAIVLLLTAASAAWGIATPQTPYRTALLILPQQFLVLVSVGSAVAATIGGVYPDGVVRPPAFILADQLPIIVAGLFHTFAVLDLSGVRVKWKA